MIEMGKHSGNCEAKEKKKHCICIFALNRNRLQKLRGKRKKKESDLTQKYGSQGWLDDAIFVPPNTYESALLFK